VTISGPTSGYTNTAYTFDGTIAPPNATAPVTYTWSPEPDSGQSTASTDYSWTSPGTYTVTLTAENCGGIVSDTHTITIIEQQMYSVYLPLVRRTRPYLPYGPDLVVTNVTIDPESLTVGQILSVCVTIENQGNEPVTAGDNFFVDLYVDQHPGPYEGDMWWGVQGSWFGVGQSRVLCTSSATQDYSFTQPGVHQIYVQVDTGDPAHPWGWIDYEQREDNNVSELIAVTVNGTGSPDAPVDATPTPGDRLPRPTPLPEADMPRPTPTPMP
jgi:PKD repeat protein